VVDKYHPFGARCCLHLQGRKPPNSTQRLNRLNHCLYDLQYRVNKTNARVKTSNLKLFPQKISFSLQNLSAFSATSETAFLRSGNIDSRRVNTVNHNEAEVSLTDYILDGMGGWFTAMFLQLGSAQGYQGFLQAKMGNGGTTSLAVLNLCVRFEVRVAPLDANHSITDSTQTINRCGSPEASHSRVTSVR